MQFTQGAFSKAPHGKGERREGKRTERRKHPKAREEVAMCVCVCGGGSRESAAVKI